MGNRKEEILQAALRLFAQRGYEAVSVSQIAGELAITKGALYKHFADKSHIFASIVQRMESDDGISAAACGAPLANGNSASWQSLKAFALNRFRYWTEDSFGSCFRRMVTIEQHRSSAMQELYQQYFASGPLNYVQEILKDLGLTDPQTMAMEFYGPMHLAYSLCDGGRQNEELLGLLEGHFNAFIKKHSTTEQEN